jgi:phosphatidylserine/phosphatidylglycerophosphate/cardiolipin synthase-like enzyme
MPDSPFTGQQDRCSRLQRAGRAALPVFFAACVAAVLLTCDTLFADDIRLLESDRSAIEARVQLIEQAEKSLDITYYIVANDCLSELFVDSLISAAQRGVCVRLIVDAIAQDIEPRSLGRLLAAGVCVREYHPVCVAKPQTWSRRMHDKVLIRDGAEMVVGSRNIEDAHFGISVVKRNYVDLDLYVSGPAVDHACVYYQCLWDSCEVADAQPSSSGLLLHRSVTAETGKDSAVVVARHRGSLHRSSLYEVMNPEPCSTRRLRLFDGSGDPRPEHEMLSTPAVSFVHDFNGKKSSRIGTTPVLHGILDSAQESIVLQSPYFIPQGELGEILRRAACRGVSIHILTNSLSTTDQVLAYAEFSRVSGRYANRGIHFWEFAGPQCLHAKSFVVDGHITCITSFNFDSRSARLNTELATIVDDEQFAGEVLEAMARNFANADPQGNDGVRLMNSEAFAGVDPARIREFQIARGLSTLTVVLGTGQVFTGTSRFLRGVARLIRRQL